MKTGLFERGVFVTSLAAISAVSFYTSNATERGVFSRNVDSDKNLERLVEEKRRIVSPAIVGDIYNIYKDSYSHFVDNDKLDKLVENLNDKLVPMDVYSEERAKEMLEIIAQEVSSIFPNLESEYFDCDDASSVFLVGRSFGLPLYQVIVPGHVFLRSDPDGKHDALNPDNPVNEGDFNWDAAWSVGGHKSIFSDKHYIDSFNLSNSSVENGSYMKNLSDSEILGIAYLGVAIVYNKIGYTTGHEDFFKVGLIYSDKALELGVENPIVYQNKANSLLRLGNYETALISIEDAIGLDESDSLPYYYKEYVLYELGDYMGAFVALRKARELETCAVSSADDN